MALSIEDYKAIFVGTEILDEDDFGRVIRNAQETKQPLEQLLMNNGFISHSQFLKLLEEHFNMKSTGLNIEDIDPKALELIPEDQAVKHLIMPFGIEKGRLQLAMVNPAAEGVLNDMQKLLEHEIEPYVTSEYALRRSLILYHGNIHDLLNNLIEQISSHVESESTNPIENSLLDKFTKSLVEFAVLKEASDIHVEVFDADIIIRYRIDGLLSTVAIAPKKLLYNRLVSRIKIMSNLKLDERRRPQDGRFQLDIQGQEVNVRVSSVPTMWGEKIVLRVLPKESHIFDLNNLGYFEDDLNTIRKHLKSPFGMILACGPTGSGKTSTLYACLQEIGSDRIDVVNISTVEDPIEYTIPRVNQIQINPEINLKFSTGLRALLRQDPDILMVGEIRDKETADISVRASLVGRLLLASLHSRDTAGAIPRLLDMGVEPYLISSTLSLVLSQRLARKLCVRCRESYKPTQDLIKELQEYHDYDNALKILVDQGIISKSSKDSIRFYKAKGCEHCDNSGYVGRTAICEVLEITDPLRSLINRRADTPTFRNEAIKEGMKPMFADGLAKVTMGITDIDELLRMAA